MALNVHGDKLTPLWLKTVTRQNFTAGFEDLSNYT